MNAFALSRMLLVRDWKAGELRLLLAALAVAVAAIATVGVFVDRLGQALTLQATQLLGADVVLVSDRDPPAGWGEEAQRRQLKTARTVSFPSMVLTEASGDALPRTQLVSLKAVSAAYPLRGTLTLAGLNGAASETLAHGPAPGMLWADAAMLQSLGVALGDSVMLGDSHFKVERIIEIEPDRGTGIASLAPRAMIDIDSLAATGLVQPASRVTHRFLVAGPAAALKAWEGWLAPKLERGQRLETLEAGRPELRTTLDRARQFLSLVSLLSALIAAVAIALAARRFFERHLSGFAVFKALGCRQRRIAQALLLEMLWVALMGSLIGAAIGFAAHWLLVGLAGSLVEMALPAPRLVPVGQAVLAGIVLVVGFAVLPILRLADVPPLRVLRRELAPPAPSAWLAIAAAVLTFGLLLLWFAGDPKLAAISLGGFIVGAVAFALISWLGVRGLAPMRGWVGAGPMGAVVKVALASWARRRGVSVAQTAALAIGLMALMLLTVTRNELLTSWQQASPVDAPNRFVLNIQPDQQAAFGKLLSAEGISGVELYPMIRARLISVNGKPIGPEQFDDDRARRLVDREFNLSYSAQIPSHNSVDSGRWIDPKAAEVSAEEGIVKTLGLAPGDKLGFDVAGEISEVTLVGTRKLAWDSMKVNFFMIGSPAVFESSPQTWITSLHLPAARSELVSEWLNRFPNLTVIDTTTIVTQVRAIIDRVVAAVQFLFVFALAAGLVVVYAALASSRDERINEAAVMRSLGASRRQLFAAQMIELAASGLLAGLMAAAGSMLVGWILASQVFAFPYRPAWWLPLAGALGGALLSALAGWLGLRDVVRRPPLATLREAAQ